MDPRYSALVLLACIYSAVQPTSANKTVPCDKTGCRDPNTYCEPSTGKCTPYMVPKHDCSTIRCAAGYKCYEGKCVTNTTCTPVCTGGQVCKQVQVQCIRAPCPPIATCVDDPCASVRCPDGEECENGECVLDKRCALVLCKPYTLCYKGICLEKTDCQPGQCKEKGENGMPMACYTGREACPTPPCPQKTICKEDRCAVMRCAYGCFDGKCMPKDKCA